MEHPVRTRTSFRASTELKPTDHIQLLGTIQQLDKAKRIAELRLRDKISELEQHRAELKRLKSKIKAASERERSHKRSQKHGAVSKAKARLGRRFQMSLLSLLSRPLTRAKRIDRLYRKTTKKEALFATISVKPSRKDQLQERRSPIGAEIFGIWQFMQSRRTRGPRLLDDFERHLLESVIESDGSDYVACSEIEQTIRSVVRRPREGLRVSSGAKKPGLLVDARTLQEGRYDGTARHAAAVLEEVLAHSKNWPEICLLIDPDKQVLPVKISQNNAQVPIKDASSVFLQNFDTFLELQPFRHRDSDVIDRILDAPWITSATVWLDAIMGTYPAHFLKSPNSFLVYQWFIERLPCFDYILALSQVARDEVTPLGTKPEIIVTGCLNPLRPYLEFFSQVNREQHKNEKRIVLFANALPHKNLAAGLYAFAYAALRSPHQLKLDVVANLSDDHIKASQALLNELKPNLDKSVRFHVKVADITLARIVFNSHAAVVPSFHEGYSLPVLEAMEFNIPVVASDIPAHRELLGQDYPLVPPDQPAAFGKALLQLTDDRFAKQFLKSAPDAAARVATFRFSILKFVSAVTNAGQPTCSHDAVAE